MWDSDSSLSVGEFLKKYKPSMVQDDGTKPWLWVRREDFQVVPGAREAATAEAVKYLGEVTDKIENIKNDASIPTRGNKKKGIKSKKELREELQAEAREQLKEISVRNGVDAHLFHSIVRLIFAPPDKVDMIWTSLATSLIEGPLASSCAQIAKVSTCPKNETPNYQHVMCLYMPDVYNQADVTEVMKILLGKHGLNLMGVKSDLYTSIGLDSKHPSGIQSTKLKDDYYSPLNAAKSPDANKAAEPNTSSAPPATTDSKAKPKLKKKKVDDDPFASDNDEGDGDAAPPEEAPKEVKAKAKKAPLKKKKVQDDFESDGDNDDEEEERKKGLKAKKATAGQRKSRSKKRPKSEDEDEDEEEEERPRKRTGRK
ncbi:hypothetical protein NLI96_g5922 [Meripilus lineatus]|uniref:Uncharacterized protein n=1 Tax=Meripilus lineatus TaxID=2056292 RepID=A0AAD5YEF3_9APHY|nr:hypothetical protein NLI96_g5922 [Physisporinus lineatus]